MVGSSRIATNNPGRPVLEDIGRPGNIIHAPPGCGKSFLVVASPYGRFIDHDDVLRRFLGPSWLDLVDSDRHNECLLEMTEYIQEFLHNGSSLVTNSLVQWSNWDTDVTAFGGYPVYSVIPRSKEDYVKMISLREDLRDWLPDDAYDEAKEVAQPTLVSSALTDSFWLSDLLSDYL